MQSSTSLRSFRVIRKEKYWKSKQVSLRSTEQQGNSKYRNPSDFPFFGFGFRGRSDVIWNGRQECKVLYQEKGIE